MEPFCIEASTEEIRFKNDIVSLRVENACSVPFLPTGTSFETDNGSQVEDRDGLD